VLDAISKTAKAKMAGDTAHVVESLPTKSKTQSTNTRTAKKKKKISSCVSTTDISQT
jgi:hypothetical protein